MSYIHSCISKYSDWKLYVSNEDSGTTFNKRVTSLYLHLVPIPQNNDRQYHNLTIYS